VAPALLAHDQSQRHHVHGRDHEVADHEGACRIFAFRHGWACFGATRLLDGSCVGVADRAVSALLAALAR